MLLHLLLSFAQVEEKGAPEKPFNRPALPLSIQYYSSTGRSVYYLAFMAIGFPRISTQRLALERPSIEARVQSVLRSPRHSRVLMALLPHTYIYMLHSMPSHPRQEPKVESHIILQPSITKATLSMFRPSFVHSEWP